MQLELAIAMGDDVDPSLKAKCSSSKPASSVRKEVLRKRKQITPPAPIKTIVHKSKPSWVDRPPIEDGMLYGVGEGKDNREAYARAVSMIASQLKVTIQAETLSKSQQETSAELIDGKEKNAKTKYKEYTSDTVRMLIENTIEDVSLADQYVSKKGRFWVLASFDVAALRAKEDAVRQAVISSLTMAGQRLADILTSDGVVEQDALFEVLAAVDDAKLMGRSKIGRKVKDDWKSLQKNLLRNVRKALGCVETTILSTQEQSPAGAKLKIKLTCNGKPISNAELNIVTEGGLLPLKTGKLTTDGEGNLLVAYGHAFGKGNIQVGLSHDTTGVTGERLLGKLKTSKKAWWEVEANSPPRIRLTVSGTSGKDETMLVVDSIAAWAKKKWGADVVPLNSRTTELEAIVRVEFTDPAEVGEKYSAGAQVYIRVNGPSGPVFDKTAKTGFVGKTPEHSKTMALKNVLRKLTKFRKTRKRR